MKTSGLRLNVYCSRATLTRFDNNNNNNNERFVTSDKPAAAVGRRARRSSFLLLRALFLVAGNLNAGSTYQHLECSRVMQTRKKERNLHNFPMTQTHANDVTTCGTCFFINFYKWQRRRRQTTRAKDLIIKIEISQKVTQSSSARSTTTTTTNKTKKHCAQRYVQIFEII